jgi:hypothetical protein
MQRCLPDDVAYKIVITRLGNTRVPMDTCRSTSDEGRSLSSMAVLVYFTACKAARQGSLTGGKHNLLAALPPCMLRLACTSGPSRL